jgi:uncharacterized protein (TIGR00255 family)
MKKAMIKSMTAFAAAENTVDQLTVTAEIRSYNSRHLDIFLRIPPAYQSLEDQIKALIADRVSRGRVEIRVQIDDSFEAASELEVDFSRAKALVSAFNDLKSQFDLKSDITLDLLISAGGLIKTVEKNQKEDIVWPVIRDCIQLALDDYEAMRQKEGDFLAEDFEQRLSFIDGCLEQIHKKSEGLLTHYQQRLKERIAQLTQNSVELDPARIAQEAAFLADRSDIAEEIVRTKSHLNQFRQMMNAVEPAGRKLNFLLQELNREFNTMGSKVCNADVAHLVIDVKSELEKIREQIQNVE